VRWAGHIACTEEKRHAHRVLVGKSEGRISLGRPGCRLDGNIKMDFREIG
jgi:hypothetical protein